MALFSQTVSAGRRVADCHYHYSSASSLMFTPCRLRYWTVNRLTHAIGNAIAVVAKTLCAATRTPTVSVWPYSQT